MNDRKLLFCILFVFGCLGGSPASGDDSRDALKTVLKSLRAGDAKALEASLEGIIEVGGKKSIAGLLKLTNSVPLGSQTVYWSLLEGISSFVDKPALGELGSYIYKNKSKAIARDLLHALQTSRTRNVVYALSPIIRKGPDSLRLKAIKKLARVRNHEAVDVLVEVVEIEEKKSREEHTAVMVAAAEGLTMITGQQFGTSAVNWGGWWKTNKDKPLRVSSHGNSSQATGTVVDHLSGLRKKGFIGLEKAPKKGIVVISAVYKKKIRRDLNNDHMEEVLRRMGIPHTVVHREDFDKFDLRETGAILINCAQSNKFCICPTCKPGGNRNNRLYRCTGCDKHIVFDPSLTADSVEKIKKFVLAGGFVFSEDWIVKEFVEKAFPKFIEAGFKLPDHNVTIAPVRGMATHPYLEGIYVAREENEADNFDFGLNDLEDDDGTADSDEGEDEGGEKGRTIVVKRGDDHTIAPELRKIRHNWQIDDESFDLTIKNRARVVSLLGSSDVKPRSADDKKKPISIVALAFRPGSGKLASIGVGKSKTPPGTPGVVVQVLSHFGKQHSDSDEFSLQNLLLNFLIDSNTARLSRSGRGRKR
ncbi:MAG: hypothetical protein VCD34_05970 [Planctomycetota bacterium]